MFQIKARRSNLDIQTKKIFHKESSGLRSIVFWCCWGSKWKRHSPNCKFKYTLE